MTKWTDDGKPAEWVTQVEPEFDVNERDNWYALTEFESETCPHCGNLRAICSDPEGLHGEGFYPQRDICYVTAAREIATRRFNEKHKKAEPSQANGYTLPTDGTTIWAATSDLTPDDDFL